MSAHDHMTPCTVRETTVAGIQVVELDNGLLSVSILVGKGADIYDIIYQPTNTDFLVKSKEGLRVFEGRNLAETRLKMYSELYPGGWQDCLPHRGRYEDVEITQENGGIAATVPWQYELCRDDDGYAGIRCFVDLPEMPIHVEKTYMLKSGEAKLYIDERLQNRGGAPMRFTWTQHAAFGGSFLDEQVTIEVPPDCVAFHARSYDRAFKSDLRRYEQPVDRVTLPDGSSRNLLQVPPKTANESFFIVLKHVREPWVKLMSGRLRIGACLHWDLQIFPFIRYWSNHTKDLYTVGLEPSNDAFAGFDDSLEHGTFQQLLPGERCDTKLVFEVLDFR
ncbi:DUF4432 family protein [Paenibacillus thalictri]|uniref:DUF4432 family protein n=1 Tax=Paenibacillus thalictri TaxID=2527873 RepID=A0A4Q9DUT9_9BACL|nr:DUF4432 family protein [Paenibacillus thalictri]TBL80125.1 DUF4432 family protein [Paenibacillus thalictri]